MTRNPREAALEAVAEAAREALYWIGGDPSPPMYIYDRLHDALAVLDALPAADGGWRPIEEAPKDGSIIPCWREGWCHWIALSWKYNRRTNLSYFGDPSEMDDYYFADKEAPTHWYPLPPPPVPQIAEDES